jgi:Holliday junction DNA helicase RuvA
MTAAWIGSLRGTLLDRGASEVIIEVGGLGYRVTVTPATAVTLGEIGDEVFVQVHHHVREDAEQLFGFPTRDERLCFEALVGAHGVGPALALAILSVHSPEALRRTLADDDVAALCLVPGVGKKTAVRLLVELKERITGAPAAADATSVVSPMRSAHADVRDALAGLGYGPDEVRDVLADLPDGGDTSVLLKHALQRLALVRR